MRLRAIDYFPHAPVSGDEFHEAEVRILKEDLRIQFALAEARQVATIASFTKPCLL